MLECQLPGGNRLVSEQISSHQSAPWLEANKINGAARVRKSVRAHAAEVIDALQNQQSNLDVLIRKHTKILTENDKSSYDLYVTVSVVSGFTSKK